MKRTAPLLALSPHEQKYDDLASWLGVTALQRLVPFSQARIDYALTVGRDENLNTLRLATWDAQHQAVLRLVPRQFKWSLSSSVCLLKHVARFYPRVFKECWGGDTTLYCPKHGYANCERKEN